MNKERKLHLCTDYYQLSVSNIYMMNGSKDKTAVFDVFIRKNPFEGGYTVFAGLEQIIEYIETLRFSEEDIQMLKNNHPELVPEFLDYLRNFKFTGELYSLKEGEIFFPQEPIIRIKAPIIEAQILETAILAIINHQSLIATKASRVCRAAGKGMVLDFGTRRAHGTEAGLYGARACLIGGCAGTSNVEAEYLFDTISKGTMSHAYVMSYKDEFEAFCDFAKYNEDNVIILVDTYDTLGSGVPNAIRLFDKLKAEGRTKGIRGIRLDSGDMAYISKKARKMLDEAGHTDAIISASSDLDEYLINDLNNQGAKIDSWGVGTKMITAFDCAALGGVYKLSEYDSDGEKLPKMKFSDTPSKITNPSYKRIVRLRDKKSGIALADLIALNDEVIDENKPLTIFHPVFTYKKRTIENFYCEDLLECIYKDGKLCYDSPSVQEIAVYHKEKIATFWEENLRFVNPHEYHIDISDELYAMKHELMRSHKKE